MKSSSCTTKSASRSARVGVPQPVAWIAARKPKRDRTPDSRAGSPRSPLVRATRRGPPAPTLEPIPCPGARGPQRSGRARGRVRRRSTPGSSARGRRRSLRRPRPRVRTSPPGRAPPQTIAASSGSPNASRSTSSARSRSVARLRTDPDHAVPVEPNPPVPRCDGGSFSAHVGFTSGIATITSCAIRSPFAIRTESPRSRFTTAQIDLAAIAGVDQAGRVRERQPVLRGQAGPRQHQSGVSFGDRHRQTGRHHRPLPGSDVDVDGGRAGPIPRRRRAAAVGSWASGCSRSEREIQSGRSISSMRLPNGSRT